MLPRLRHGFGGQAGGAALVDWGGAKAALGPSPSFGTSSIRRTAQMRAIWPDGRFAAVRGNVDTRLRKLDGGEFDALVLAAAGLKRLGHARRISLAIDVAHCVPAPCQGIVAIETRADVPPGARAINDPLAEVSFKAERALIAALGGGCQLPLGAIATPRGAALEMEAIVVSPDGSRRVRGTAVGDAARPEELGRQLAGALARDGAVAILDEVR